MFKKVRIKEVKANSIRASYYAILLMLCVLSPDSVAQVMPRLLISANSRFIQTNDGKPFFWLGDTGWYLFSRLNREEVIRYLDDREDKGFNLIQCMAIPYLPLENIYNRKAFISSNISEPLVTAGKDASDSIQYDYWDHVEFVVDEAARRNIYIGIVCIWGSVAKMPAITNEQLQLYTSWLVQRFRNKFNIVWMNGGDLKGNIVRDKWELIGSTIRRLDTLHLITYHPFGRTQSSTWFHGAEWLDFNMFQSGHRRYDQKRGDGDDNPIGEDNWRYVLDDYQKLPPKPTLDGEPSYENIPQGLHDTTQPYWQAADCRRYAYWSVFSGACGHTYGNNSVMQFYKPGKFGKPAYGAKESWEDAIDDSGSFQMQHLKNLILSRPYFERRYDSTIIIDQGVRYNYIPVTRGKSYLFAYTYNGRTFSMHLGIITGKKLLAHWYNPSSGNWQKIGTLDNSGIYRFTPPGEMKNGNDWVLVLDDKDK